MVHDEIKLSVALVTRNRPDSLERTLKSLRAQDVQPWEVIVSDDSDAEYALEVERVAAAHDCRYLTGPHRGLYSNRNHVALACNGTHIRTMDDDHEFPRDHFDECLKAIACDPQSVWIIGEFLPAQKIKAIPDCPGQLNPRGFSTTPPDTQACWAISDGASMYPRSIFEAGIHYIADYKFGAAYLEFGSRLNWLGYRLRHLNSTYIIHHYDPNTRSFLDLSIDLASRFCAMLCHSYIYQPTMLNKALCHLEILKQIVLHRMIAIKALATGLSGFRKQRSTVLSYAQSRKLKS